MTKKRSRSIEDCLFNSQEQFKKLLPSALSEQINILGKTGDTSAMDLIDTLMLYYDTLPKRHQVKLWTVILDFSMLLTVRGTASLG